MKSIYRLPLFGLAVILLLLDCFPALAERTATGEPVLYFGFVVDITVTDPGAGYVNAPSVSITGGGGAGAVAVATITNGAVSDIVVLETGSGYTNSPTVVISPPPRALILSVRLAPLLTMVGEPYSVAMIQWADALGDTNQWFTITNLAVGTNPVQWCDMTSGAAEKRFYRAVAAPEASNPDPAS